MKYNSLLLNCGGGIINPATKSAQFSQSAALCIGIGGTGIAALCDLKGKIYQQLTPDNPGESIPRYDGIQLLGIDSDERAPESYSGNRRLSSGEFFSIKGDSINNLLQNPDGKKLIKKDPLMYWMEIDQINKMLSPDGAGGVRQMGRFLLMSKAATLFGEIQKKCRIALQKRGNSSLDIYIFAGISGGTGSGCFLDTCYLVRQVVEANGWNAKIMGYFFLPDVVTSKPEVAAQPGCVAYNNSNGYAAMKELDYLMNLKENEDWFHQNYGTGITVDTQLPPVDMCHLISASRADGSLVADGFNYGINVASDYAMTYLADVDLNGATADQSSLTMRGHLANVNTGVGNIPRRWGANLSYHILGASNAEIPMTQINTYLAAGFFRKFAKSASISRSAVTQSDVGKLMESLRLNAAEVYNGVVNGIQGLDLPDIDRKVLAQQAVCPLGKLNTTWADTYNYWYADCNGIMTKNANGLTKGLDDFSYAAANAQSLIGRLFQKLWDLSVDPEYGPYYAAYLLSNNGDDLYAALTGEIQKADDQAQANRIQLSHMQESVVDLNQELVEKKGKQKCYDNYLSAVMEWLNREMATIQCTKTAEVLRTLRNQVDALYNGFFRPLCELLDNLQDTFGENSNYLKTPEAAQTSAYTWQILSLDDIRKRLDDAIAHLNTTQLVNRFIQSLLENSSVWLNGEEEKICMHICSHMIQLFSDETNRSLQDYLIDKYPETNGDIVALAAAIEKDILKRVYDSAIPMFWCDPVYMIMDPTYTFESSSLSVPGSCSAICSAASSFSQNHPNFAVRQTGIGDRIFALRFISGIPLFAYQGVTKLKGDYDAAQGKPAGAGAHLYSNTGRGGSNLDWREYIPTPMPYSRSSDPKMHPEGGRWAKVYREAVKRGIIGVTGTADIEIHSIFTTPKLKVKDYTAQDFMDGEVFSKSKYDAELARIRELIETLYNVEKNPELVQVNLKNDGNKDLCEDLEAVRIDYFILAPLKRQLVLDEIDKYEKLKAAEAKLVQIHTEYFAYEKDLNEFTTLLFWGVLECRNISDNVSYDKTASVRCCYVDRHSDPASFYLTESTPDFALYKAFLTYRGKTGGAAEAWEKLEEELEQLKTAKIKLENTYVAAALEQVWDGKAMEKLRKEGLKGATDTERTEILRFYNGLRANIRGLRDMMAEWPKGMTVAQLTAAIAGTGAVAENTTPAASAQLPDVLYIWSNGQNLVVYPKQYPNWAWDQNTNSWVPLNPGMYVWSAQKNAWEPIRLDIQGNILYG